MKRKFLLSCFIIVSLVSCIGTTKETSIFMKDCLLTVEELPEGNWKFSAYVLPPVLQKEGASSAIEAHFEIDGGFSNYLAAHTVYRYKNFLLAEIFSRINREIYFPSKFLSWQKVNGSDNWELHADEWKIQCATTEEEFFSDNCTAVMRYEKYIIVYSLPLNNETGTYENFEDIVFIIDQKMDDILIE